MSIADRLTEWGMFFDDRAGLDPVPVVGPLDDAALVPAVRVSGERT